MWTRTLLLATALPFCLTACGKEEVEEEEDPPPINTGDDTASTCGGTPPVVLSVSCENTGVKDHYETGVPTVTMGLWIEVNDEDGDLTQYEMQVYFDDVIDGAVDPASASGFNPITDSVEGNECEVTAATLGLNMYLQGGAPYFDTEYEWGVIIRDAGGVASELTLTTCYTPTATGEDGGQTPAEGG